MSLWCRCHSFFSFPSPALSLTHRQVACVNQIRHLSVTHTKRDIVAAPIVTCSLCLPSHIGGDGVMVFFCSKVGWVTWRERGGVLLCSLLSSPEEVLWSVNLPRAVLLQARRRTIISQSRWKGASALLAPTPSCVSPYCWNLV